MEQQFCTHIQPNGQMVALFSCLNFPRNHFTINIKSLNSLHIELLKVIER